MRLPFAFVLALIVATPAHAQIDDDFYQANRIFGQVSATSVVENLEGEWLPLSTLSNLNGADPDPGLVTSFIERICGNDPARGAIFTNLDEASFEMTTATSGGELVHRFDWIGGAQFHRSVDPEALFQAFNLDTMEGEKGIEMRSRMLASTTSLVDLYRISPELLAMATSQRVEIYGRCPA